MNFSHLDLNLLVTLSALLDEESVTRAAHRLHRSPAAVSEALGRLRAFFDDELLIRSGRRMAPTPLAESLAGPLKECLIRIEETVTSRPSFDPSRSQRQFKMIVSDYVSTTIVAPALVRLQREAPGVIVEMFPHVERPWAALSRGSFDFLVIPRELRQESHPWETLFEDEYVCAAWSENPLLAGELTLEKFLGLGRISVSLGIERLSSIDEDVLAQYGATGRVEVIATTFNSVPQLLVGTNRIAVLQKRLASLYARLLPIAIYPPPVPMPSFTEVIQWHKHHSNDPALQWMLSVLKGVASSGEE